ncbi:MAG: TIGR00282 family metallophosphoesterase [Erysipelotrichaceae bacterium]|nr:TIGR00282 family metallophosphoesterase [Erysipelotrichaceae bacterium]
MNILFIGDIVGKSGRDVISSLLYSLKKENKIDLVIANGENSAHGKGITYKIYNSLISDGIDYITMGNHTYSKSEINTYMDDMRNLVVPYNHKLRTTDNYYKIIEYKGLRICLTNILSDVLIGEADGDAYEAFEKVLENTRHLNPDFYFVDLHAEATATKRVFIEHFKEYAKVVVGTHTHVQTADERMIGDCAFITDVGMCGSYDSVIGRDIEESIITNVYHDKTHFTVSNAPAIFCAVVIEIDEKLKKPVSIRRIQIRP